jgi:hypothetical protein
VENQKRLNILFYTVRHIKERNQLVEKLEDLEINVITEYISECTETVKGVRYSSKILKRYRFD